MRPEWLRRFRRLLLVLYLASFVLPLGKGLGAAAFVVALCFGFAVPVLLVMWAANPLFWFGLSDLRRGHYGRATILGILACLAALLPMLPFGGEPLGVIWHLPADSFPPFGYFAWLASIVGLTVVATAVWWAQSRPRIHIATIMIAIAAIALHLAAWTLIGPVLRLARVGRRLLLLLARRQRFGTGRRVDLAGVRASEWAWGGTHVGKPVLQPQ